MTAVSSARTLSGSGWMGLRGRPMGIPRMVSPSLMIASHGEGRPSCGGSLKKCIYLRQTVMM